MILSRKLGAIFRVDSERENLTISANDIVRIRLMIFTYYGKM